MPIIVDQLKMTPAASLTATAASSVVQTTAGANLIMALPGSARFSANKIWIFASGYAQSGPGTFTATVQPILYGDASLATVTTKPLFSATAGTLAYTGTAAAGAAIPWYLQAEILGDNASGTFNGEGESAVGAAAYKIRTQLTAPVSTINFNTEPCVKFAIGNTTAGTVGTSFKFVVESFQVLDE